jgi:hypothetical protein
MTESRMLHARSEDFDGPTDPRIGGDPFHAEPMIRWMVLFFSAFALVIITTQVIAGFVP